MAGSGDELEAAEARLAEVAARRRERDHLHATADAARERAAGCREVLRARLAELEEEESDVRALTSLSLTRVLSSMRGAREGELRREEAEREAARYKVGVARSRLDAAEQEVAAAEARLGHLGGVDVDWLDALAATERAVLALAGSDDVEGHQRARADRLVAIAELDARSAAVVDECAEAVGAGRVALDRLDAAQRVLGSADDWSAYDTWFGGGLLVSMVKHDRLDQAVAVLADAQVALRHLAAEVADLGRSAEIRLRLDGWERAADTWFDNLWTDLSVRRRIKDASAQVAAARRATEEVLADVDARARAAADERAALHEERTRLLTG